MKKISGCIALILMLFCGSANAQSITAGQMVELCESKDKEFKAMCAIGISGFMSGYRRGKWQGMWDVFVFDEEVLRTTIIKNNTRSISDATNTSADRTHERLKVVDSLTDCPKINGVPPRIFVGQFLQYVAQDTKRLKQGLPDVLHGMVREQCDKEGLVTLKKIIAANPAYGK